MTKPEVRSAPGPDFFLDILGTKYIPFMLDDGDANKLETRKLKAFLEVGEEETMTRERGGGRSGASKASSGVSVTLHSTRKPFRRSLRTSPLAAAAL